MKFEVTQVVEVSLTKDQVYRMVAKYISETYPDYFVKDGKLCEFDRFHSIVEAKNVPQFVVDFKLNGEKLIQQFGELLNIKPMPY